MVTWRGLVSFPVSAVSARWEDRLLFKPSLPEAEEEDEERQRFQDAFPPELLAPIGQQASKHTHLPPPCRRGHVRCWSCLWQAG